MQYICTMSSNNHALIRYRTIDRCLKSANNYFLKDLIRECSEAVHTYEEHRTGKSKPYKEISRRSLLYDLKFMKDEVHGFGAPITWEASDGYSYEGGTFELFRTKISKTDMDRLDEALLILKQLSGEAGFSDLESLVTRLEETYQIRRKRKDRSIVQFEHSTNIDGQKWVATLKEKIRTQSTIWSDYRPFGEEAYKRIFSPYLLKEYNNRWFLIGYDYDSDMIRNLGLDRILSIKDSLVEYKRDESFDSNTYLEDIVGVSIPDDSEKVTVQLKAHGRQKFYLETKPLHESQEKISEKEDHAIFQLELIPNFELKAKLMANADSLEVQNPEWLRKEMSDKLEVALSLHNS